LNFFYIKYIFNQIVLYCILNWLISALTEPNRRFFKNFLPIRTNLVTMVSPTIFIPFLITVRVSQFIPKISSFPPLVVSVLMVFHHYPHVIFGSTNPTIYYDQYWQHWDTHDECKMNSKWNFNLQKKWFSKTWHIKPLQNCDKNRESNWKYIVLKE